MTIVRLLLASVVVFFVAATADAAKLGPVPAQVAGTYSATLPNYVSVGLYKGRYTLVLGPGSRIAYHIPSYSVFLSFVASYDGNHITLPTDLKCTTPGTYAWTQHGTTLEIKKVRDPCRVRAILLDRRWTKLTHR